jgi:hypothetical protein
VNKTTALLKDAILKAAEAAGGPSVGDRPGGIVAYLQQQAKDNPGPFMALLGKVLPMQVTGEGGKPIEHTHGLKWMTEAQAKARGWV